MIYQQYQQRIFFSKSDYYSKLFLKALQGTIVDKRSLSYTIPDVLISHRSTVELLFLILFVNIHRAPWNVDQSQVSPCSGQKGGGRIFKVSVKVKASSDTEIEQRAQGTEGDTKFGSSVQFNKHTLKVNFQQGWFFLEHRRQRDKALLRAARGIWERGFELLSALVHWQPLCWFVVRTRQRDFK